MVGLYYIGIHFYKNADVSVPDELLRERVAVLPPRVPQQVQGLSTLLPEVSIKNLVARQNIPQVHGLSTLLPKLSINNLRL